MQTLFKSQPAQHSRRATKGIAPHEAIRSITSRLKKAPVGTSVSTAESLVESRPGTSYDSFFDLRRLVNFEDIPARNGTERVLRCDRNGVSIYVYEIPSKKKAGHSIQHFVVAYEGETETSQHVKQVILQSESVQSIWGLLKLLARYTQLAHRRMKALPHSSAPIDIELRQITGFNSRSQREKINKSLTAMSCSDLGIDAYEGFVNAVMSQVDDQLANHR